MERLEISTNQKRQVVDITDLVQDQISTLGHGGTNGICHLSVLHTTAALTCADLDPGTDLDMLDAFEAMMPKLRYRHPHDPSHVPDHILSALVGPSIAMPLHGGRLMLGQWQRIVLMEFDGPRKRNIIITVIKE